MSVRKPRPVLYELIARGQKPRGWTATLRGPSSSRAAGVASAGASAAAAAGAGASGSSTASSADAAEMDSGAALMSELPGFATAWVGGHLHLAFSPLYLGIVGAGTIVLLALAFFAGYRAGSPGTHRAETAEQLLAAKPEPAAPADERHRSDPQTTHRPSNPVTVPPRPDLLPDKGPDAHPEARLDTGSDARPGEPPPAKAAEPGDKFEFSKGLSYVVVQHLSKRAGGDAADKIRDFLVASGVPCVVYARGPDLQVIATQAFDVKKKPESAAKDERERARALMDKIRKLGEQYVTHGYSFEKCYLREF